MNNFLNFLIIVLKIKENLFSDVDGGSQAGNLGKIWIWVSKSESCISIFKIFRPIKNPTEKI